MSRLWGSSPKDIWTVSGGYWEQSISHFDSKTWSSFGIPGIFPTTIYGFSNNDVYMGAQSGKIWNYNGSSWSLFAELTAQGTAFIMFENIWGETNKDFYAVGNGPDENDYANFSIIAHYVNNKWEILNNKGLTGNVIHIYKNNPDQKIYFVLSKIEGAVSVDSTIIYELYNKSFIKLYSSSEVKGFQADISLIDGKVYFVLGNNIAMRLNNHFQTILNVDNSNFYQRIWGRSSKDIFLLMTDGLAHYNGTDIEYLFHFTLGDIKAWTQIYGAALFDNDVFFLVYEPTTNLNLIYHGTLSKEGRT